MQKKHVKWILYFAAPVILLVPFNTWYKTTQHVRTIITHPQKTGITTLYLMDTERQRPLITEIWYPVHIDTPSKAAVGLWIRCEESRDEPVTFSKNQYPLIVMSHGHGGNRFTISWLAEIFAANGYIVAAMDHYGNTWDNKIPDLSAKPWERPKDVSFVLDQLMEHPKFKNLINPQQIGFVGYSLGGATGMWIAGAQITQVSIEDISNFYAAELPEFATPEVLGQVDFNQAQYSYQDPRFKAIFTMAPALGSLFDISSLENITVPICIVTTRKDRVVPVEKNATIFAKTIKKATLKILNNDGDHYVFLNRASAFGRRLLEPRFFEDPHQVDRVQIHQEVGKTAVEFFDHQFNLKP